MRPKITLGALIVKRGKILLIKRANEPFRGCWCMPGGHLKWGERAKTGIKREVKEETGLDFKPNFLTYHDEIIPKISWHAVPLVFKGGAKGKLKPGKETSKIAFFDPRKLPKKMAFFHRRLIKQYLTKNWL